VFISQGTCVVPPSLGSSSLSKSFLCSCSPPSTKLPGPPSTFPPTSPSYLVRCWPCHHLPRPIANSAPACALTYLHNVTWVVATARHSYGLHRLATYPYILSNFINIAPIPSQHPPSSPPASWQCWHHCLIFFLHCFLNFAFLAWLQCPYLTMNLRYWLVYTLCLLLSWSASLFTSYPQFYPYALLISPCDFPFIVVRLSLTNNFLYLSLHHSHLS